MRSRAEDRRASHTAPAGALGSAKEFRVRISAVPSPGPQQGACPRGRRVSACAHHTDAIHADCTDYVVMVAGFHWHSCRPQQDFSDGRYQAAFLYTLRLSIFCAHSDGYSGRHQVTLLYMLELSIFCTLSVVDIR